MKTMYTAVATSLAGRNGNVESPDGVLEFDIRLPENMRGKEGAYANSEQLYVAGYSTCFGSALNYVAMLKKKKIISTVTVKISIEKKDNGSFQLAVEMDVKIPGMYQKEAEELVKEAYQTCRYSNAICNNIEMILTVTTTILSDKDKDLPANYYF